MIEGIDEIHFAQGVIQITRIDVGRFSQLRFGWDCNCGSGADDFMSPLMAKASALEHVAAHQEE